MQLSVPSLHSLISVHVLLSVLKVYPTLQSHVNDPGTFVQSCWQLSVLLKHSLISGMKKNRSQMDTDILGSSIVWLGKNNAIQHRIFHCIITLQVAKKASSQFLFIWCFLFGRWTMTLRSSLSSRQLSIVLPLASLNKKMCHSQTSNGLTPKILPCLIRAHNLHRKYNTYLWPCYNSYRIHDSYFVFIANFPYQHKFSGHCSKHNLCCSNIYKNHEYWCRNGNIH